MNYQRIIIAGNATNDAVERFCPYIKIIYTTFCVGVRTGENASTFFPIEAVCDTARYVANSVTKGRQVLVEGEIEGRDKGRFVVVARRVILGVSSNKKSEAPKKKTGQ